MGDGSLDRNAVTLRRTSGDGSDEAESPDGAVRVTDRRKILDVVAALVWQTVAGATAAAARSSVSMRSPLSWAIA